MPPPAPEPVRPAAGAGWDRAVALDLLGRQRARSIEFPAFFNEAKRLLGPDWPGGTPKKAVITDLLERRLGTP